MNLKLTTLSFAGLNLLANFGFSQPVQAQSTVVNAPNLPTTHQINLASRTAVESSWLNVPMRCKDRSFAFDPTVISADHASPGLSALHAELDTLADGNVA